MNTRKLTMQRENRIVTAKIQVPHQSKLGVTGGLCKKKKKRSGELTRKRTERDSNARKVTHSERPAIHYKKMMFLYGYLTKLSIQ